MIISGCIFVRRCWRRLLDRLVPGPRILLYHRVTELPSDPQLLAVSPTRFAEHLEVLREQYQVLRLAELVKAVLDGRATRRMVAITFDDGYADNLYEAKPLLEKQGLPATVFVASGTMNTAREFWWDDLERLLLLPDRSPSELCLRMDGEEFVSSIGDSVVETEERRRDLSSWSVEEPDDPTSRHALYRKLCRRVKSLHPRDRERVLSELRRQTGTGEVGRRTHRALTDEELRSLAGGTVDIGGHTVTHPMLAMLPLVEQQAEIRDGNARLERILGEPVRAFSYPFGDRSSFTAETIACVRQQGIAYACANYPERCHAGGDWYRLPRHVVRNWSADQFIQWLRT